MSSGRVLTPAERTDWLGSWWTLPSWLISLILHVLTLLLVAYWLQHWQRDPAGFGDEPTREVLLVAYWLQHWQRDPAGFGDEPTREVGIVLKSAGVDLSERPVDSPSEANPVDPAPSDALESTPVATPTTAMPSTPRDATAAADIPATVLGAGSPFATAGAPDARDVVKSGGQVSASAALSGALPGAAFMGAQDQGTRVVFIVDCSASMANYGAMRSAKAALMSSLQTLSDAQQFQIVFYNQSPRPMTIRGNANGQLAFATEVNKSFARQHISAIEPDLGTDHMPALRLALRMSPEVIFFLTDADEPQLSAKELSEIQRLNQGRTRIHTIEFGIDSGLDVDNFLKKLARQNGGTYRYYDVKRLRSP